MTTDEAVAMICFAAEMVRTDGLKAVRVDTQALEFGPDRPGAVAAVLAALTPGGVRVAVIAPESQLRQCARILRLAHLEDAAVFSSPGEAENWLAERIGHRRQLPPTARRHVDDLLGVAPAPDPSSAPARHIGAA